MAFVRRVAHHCRLPTRETAAVIAGLEQVLYNPEFGAPPPRSQLRRLTRQLRYLRWRTLVRS